SADGGGGASSTPRPACGLRVSGQTTDPPDRTIAEPGPPDEGIDPHRTVPTRVDGLAGARGEEFRVAGVRQEPRLVRSQDEVAGVELDALAGGGRHALDREQIAVGF